MKAMIISNFGDSDVLEAKQIPRPALGPEQILVSVAATSVNPVDWKIRRLGPPIAPVLPAVLHGDVAGVVEEVGIDVDDFKPGDEVYGCGGGVKGHCGALAERMVCNAALMAKKPKSLSMGDAAALPLVTITAWEGLVDRANVQAGQSVLVHAGAGGVGHIATQIAMARGAKVFATVSGPEKAAIVESYGATAINYRDLTVENYVAQYTDGAGFDVVYDTVGGDNLTKSLVATATNGTVVSCQINSTQDLTPMHQKGLSLHGIFMLLPMLTGMGQARHGEIMREAAILADEGKLKPLIDPSNFELTDAPAAHALLENGNASGKVVIHVNRNVG